MVIALLILAGVGAFAGILAGLFGVGGGIVLVPAFLYIFEYLGYQHPQLMQVCLATSLATIIFTSFRSLHQHKKRGSVEWPVLVSWGPGIILGAIFGVFFAVELHTNTLEKIFGALLVVIGGYLVVSKPHWRIAEELPNRFLSKVYGVCIGFLSVLLGIGGGSLGVPAMTLHGLSVHRAVATAAGFGAIIAVPSVIGFLFVYLEGGNLPYGTIGAVNIPAFFTVVGMTYLTTPIGVYLAHRLNAVRLKRYFAFFLILVALNMLRKAFGI